MSSLSTVLALGRTFAVLGQMALLPTVVALHISVVTTTSWTTSHVYLVQITCHAHPHIICRNCFPQTSIMQLGKLSNFVRKIAHVQKELVTFSDQVCQLQKSMKLPTLHENPQSLPQLLARHPTRDVGPSFFLRGSASAVARLLDTALGSLWRVVIGRETEGSGTYIMGI